MTPVFQKPPQSSQEIQHFMDELLRNLRDAHYVGSQLIQGGAGTRYDFQNLAIDHVPYQITIELYDQRPIFQINQVLAGEGGCETGLGGDFSFNEVLFGASQFPPILQENYWILLQNLCHLAKQMRLETGRIWAMSILMRGIHGYQFTVQKLTPTIYDFVTESLTTNYAFRVIDRGFFNQVEEVRLPIYLHPQTAFAHEAEATYQAIIDQQFPELQLQTFPPVGETDFPWSASQIPPLVVKFREHFPNRYLRIYVGQPLVQAIPNFLEIPKVSEQQVITQVFQLEHTRGNEEDHWRLFMYQLAPDVEFQNYHQTTTWFVIQRFLQELQTLYADDPAVAPVVAQFLA